MTPGPRIEPGTYWWEGSAFTTAPSLLPRYFISVSSGTNKRVQHSFLFQFMHSFSANAHANVKHILSDTFVKVYRNCLQPEGKMFKVNGRQFSFVQRLKKRGSGN